MKIIKSSLLLCSLSVGISLPHAVFSSEQELEKKIEALNVEINSLKTKSERSMDTWLMIGGDFRFRVDGLGAESKVYTNANMTFDNAYANAVAADVAGNTQANVSGFNTFAKNMKLVSGYAESKNFLANNAAMLAGMGAAAQQVAAYKPKNETLYTNRAGFDLHAKATKDVTVNARLVAYKTFGVNDDQAVTGSGNPPFFADRVGVFDGTTGHVPSSSGLSIDRAYATWSNIAEQPLWFSVGRRPSTNGSPTHLKLNNPAPGNGGTPALLVDYAFDGMTVGIAPDIDKLPGAYAKFCYGRGYESGISKPTGNSLKDTDMIGVAIVPVDTDPLRIHLQWNRGSNIFDFPTMDGTYFGNTSPSVQLGSIDWFGTGVLSTLKNVGPGTLNLFAEIAMSRTRANNNVSGNAGFQGLLTGSFLNPEAPSNKTGEAVYLGMRYDLASLTKLGFEYNRGTKNWITFAPAADDMWTSKAGVRGDVYETYIIQELGFKPLSSYHSKAFFKLGYQYYNFEYTGSNNWVGAPKKIDDLAATDMQLMTPLKTAHNIYGTFEVKF
ncbi:MAG: hypothetical protein A2X86_12520 [Bdellovibrionales bacterium GWA2_49_15]|nr:MAG: hypothetical protein A2X86_12520 [Bdellovibrionales bacterium GWA2_49_15]HAZ14676.1 DUF3373 domain-containing protein [Bdellovibrionales bacterium]